MGFLSNIEKDLKALTKLLGGDEKKEQKTPKKKIVKKTKRGRPKKKR